MIDLIIKLKDVDGKLHAVGTDRYFQRDLCFHQQELGAFNNNFYLLVLSVSHGEHNAYKNNKIFVSKLRNNNVINIFIAKIRILLWR